MSSDLFLAKLPNQPTFNIVPVAYGIGTCGTGTIHSNYNCQFISTGPTYITIQVIIPPSSGVLIGVCTSQNGGGITNVSPINPSVPEQIQFICNGLTGGTINFVVFGY